MSRCSEYFFPFLSQECSVSAEALSLYYGCSNLLRIISLNVQAAAVLLSARPLVLKQYSHNPKLRCRLSFLVIERHLPYQQN